MSFCSLRLISHFLQAVLLGIDHPGVTRLKKVGKLLSAAERNFLIEIKQLIDTTELYRKHVEALGDVPCIPYIGTHVRLMSEAYAKNASKITTDKGIGYTAARSVSDVMYNYLRFQRFRYFDGSGGLTVQEELYAQLVHIPVFSDEKLNDLSASIQPLDRKEKKGIASPSTIVSPRTPSSPATFGSALGSLFSPRKGAAKRGGGGDAAPQVRGRGDSLGDGDSQ